jgi:NAD(P)-dependent dehydrogenase (short-subunit alcohol dehydrogenase family)
LRVPCIIVAREDKRGGSTMAGRVEGKVAIVVGGGQTPGETIGNGRATAMLLGREGARVLVVDRSLERAQETVDLMGEEGAKASAFAADITGPEANRSMVEACLERYSRIDILHNNVGASVALGDAEATALEPEAFDTIVAVNLKGMWLSCKYALPVMRDQGSGSIVNISSVAAIASYPFVGYKTTKAGVIALTENLAMANAGHNIRVNAILPGLMNTPMAIEARVQAGASREELIAARDRMVPLGRKMGSGWDVAQAALFLHSDDASFITGVSLRVDGGGALTR